MSSEPNHGLEIEHDETRAEQFKVEGVVSWPEVYLVLRL